MSKLSKRITAMLLAGILVIGSVPGSVLAASTDVDPGQTSEIAQEVFSEEISETLAGEGETAEIEETSEVPSIAWENYSEEATSEEGAEVQYYTVTLDANGGYFENEWDDSIGDYAQQAEVVEKHIPVDGIAAANPVFIDQDGQTMVFAGWSLERDGELISQAEEEYIPVDNCVLYAVWQAEDSALVETGKQEVADEGPEQADSVQESEKYYAAEESADAVTSEENPVEEDVVTGFTEDASDVPVGSGETTQVENISEELATIGETAEEVLSEEAEEAQYYTVTLDANGGYFENEWDDSIGDYIERAEVVEKQIPVGGTIAAFPVFIDPDGQTMIFAGWSLERDGELVSQAEEKYVPVDNCVLYAVWKGKIPSDYSDAIFEDTELSNENEESETNTIQKYQDNKTDYISEEAYTNETELVQEDTIEYYTVTLDANGGYFVGEWDDVKNERVENVDVLSKIIPVDESVTSIPIKELNGENSSFLGWSLEKDGELIADEEDYSAFDDCILFAIWDRKKIEEELYSDDNALFESPFSIEEQENKDDKEVLEDNNINKNLDYVDSENKVVPSSVDKLHFNGEMASNDNTEEIVSTDRLYNQSLQKDAKWFLGKIFVGVEYDEYIVFSEEKEKVYANFFRGSEFLKWELYVNSQRTDKGNKWEDPWENGPQKFSQLIGFDYSSSDYFNGVRRNSIGASSFNAIRRDDDPIWGQSWTIVISTTIGSNIIYDRFLLMDNDDSELRLKNLFCTGKVGDLINITATVKTNLPSIYIDGFVSKTNVAKIDNFRVVTSQLSDGCYHRITATLSCLSKGETSFTIKADDKTAKGTLHVDFSSNWLNSDEWSFGNYGKNGKKITSSMEKDILNNISSKSEKERVRGLIKKKNNGQCFGMANTSLLVKLGELSLSEISSGLTTLHDAKRNKQTESVIAYYHLTQYTPLFKNLEKRTLQMTPENIYRSLVYTPTPYVVCVRGQPKLAHAVVATGIESGNWTFHDHSYDTRILTYDSNFPNAGDTHEERYLYINSTNYEWEFPHYYYKYSSYSGGYISLMSQDINLLKNLDFNKEQNKAYIQIDSVDSVNLQISGSVYDVSCNQNTEKYSSFCDIADIGDTLTQDSLNIIVEQDSNMRLIPQDIFFPEESKITILSGNYYYSAEGFSTGVETTPEGSMVVKETKGDTTFSITSDAPISNSIWSTISVSGNNMGDYSFDWTDEGVIITADDLSSATISFSDGNDSTVSVAPNFTSNSIILYEEDGNILYKYTDQDISQEVTGIDFNQSDFLLCVNESKQLSASVVPENASDTKIIWTSSNTNVATVSSTGLVRAIAPGIAIIQAQTRSGGFRKSCIVSVDNSQIYIPVKGLSFNQEDFSLAIGASKQLVAHTIPENSTEKGIIWTSDNKKVAEITENGKVDAISPGTAIIQVKTVDGGYIKSCVVTVNEEQVDINRCDIALSSNSFSYDGTEKIPDVTISYSGNTLIEGSDYTLTYKNNINAGTASCIILGNGHYSGQIEKIFSISKTTQTVTAIPWTDTLGVGQSTFLNIVGIGSINVTSSDNNVAYIDSGGWIVGKSEGNVTFTVTASGDNNYKNASTSFPFSVLDIYEIDSNTCGENATWHYYNDGTVLIDGSGKIYNAKRIPDSLHPSTGYTWSEYYNKNWFEKVHTVIIAEGISEIGDWMFAEYGGNGEGHMPDSPNTIILSDSIKKIGRMAFYKCHNLQNVFIGSGLSEIDEYAFSCCPLLKEISVSENNLNFTSIEGSLYSKDLKTLYRLAHNGCEEYNIPSGVKILERDCMGDMAGLTSITIPLSVSCIKMEALDGSTDLKDIYYQGSKSDWEKIDIHTNNETLLNANIHFAVPTKKISDCKFTLSSTTYVYNGTSKQPSLTINDDNYCLIKDKDYALTFSNNTNAGNASITITGIGDYEGTITKSFIIKPVSIANTTVTGLTTKTYNGKAITQAPVVKSGNRTLIPKIDYSVSYSNNTQAGTATVTFKGIGNYNGTKKATFKINKAAQSITAKAGVSSVAVGKTTTVSISGAKGAKSFKSSDTGIATVSSTGKVTAKKVGKVTITATSAATANYKAASKTVTIKVVPAATSSLTAENQATGIKLTWKKVAGANAYFIYRGSTQIASIKNGSIVTYTDKKATANGTKYTYKIIASASATGRSTLSKSVTVYCVTVPAISTLTNSVASKMTVKWGKNAKATGYQIQYCPDKTFKPGNKSVSITSASTVSKVIGSLAKSKTYYVRIRTYKTAGSTKYFSAWSAVKSVKITK